MQQGGRRKGVFSSSDPHVQRSGSERECGFLEELKVFQQDFRAPGGKTGWPVQDPITKC